MTENLIEANSPMEVVTAIQAGKKAELKWSRSKAADRADMLYKMADLIEAHMNKWSEEEAKELKLSKDLLLEINYRPAIHSLRSWKVDKSGPDRQAVGSCALILPWVTQLKLFTQRLAYAVGLGNTLIVKASSVNRAAAAQMQYLAKECLPEGVCQVLYGKGDEIGELLANHPALLAVDFAGSYKLGEQLLKQCTRPSKKLRFEMGSKNSAIIFDDADFSEVIPEVLKSAFTGGGQLVENISRVFVSTKRYPEFIEELKKHNDQLSGYRTELVTEQKTQAAQLAIQELKNEGAKSLIDESLPTPQVFYDVSMCSPYQQDSISGPVLLVNEFKYLHEAEKWVNTGYHGYGAQLWTKDLEKAKKFAAKLEVGRLWINRWIKPEDVPGWSLKSSGYGYQSPDGLLDFYSNCTQIFD